MQVAQREFFGPAVADPTAQVCTVPTDSIEQDSVVQYGRKIATRSSARPMVYLTSSSTSRPARAGAGPSETSRSSLFHTGSHEPAQLGALFNGEQFSHGEKQGHSIFVQLIFGR